MTPVSSGSKQTYLHVCPLCGSQTLRRAYSFAAFAILRCDMCNNSWRSNMYDPAMIDRLYCGDSYANENYFADGGSAAPAAPNRRIENYRRALQYLEQATCRGRLLDIGCGGGVFLSMAKAQGWSVSGVELSPRLAEKCRGSLNVPVLEGRFEDVLLPAAAFDVVTLWDIIEHVIDPVACIERARSLLKPGGILVFCTPDEDSLLARIGLFLYKATVSRYVYPALALHPPYHTYFFSRTGFARTLQDLGLDVMRSWSQEAFFEHSDLAGPVQKAGIRLIERVAGWADQQYEMVFFARSSGDAHG